MFGLSFEHLLILVVAALFILGPERLPEAMRWTGKTIRQIRDYATGAREQMRNELGPEFDELRKPLEDLNALRGLNPKNMVSRYLMDDNATLPFSNGSGGNGSAPVAPVEKPNGYPAAGTSGQAPLEPGQRPPFDSEAT